jgi:hypothetical protein
MPAGRKRKISNIVIVKQLEKKARIQKKSGLFEMKDLLIMQKSNEKFGRAVVPLRL